MQILNRVLVATATTGTGTLTLGAAEPGGWLTAEQAGGTDGQTVTYVIEEGSDFEIGRGVLGASATTLTRATVEASKIGGVPGTAKMELTGQAKVFLAPSAADLADLWASAPMFKRLPEDAAKTASYTLTAADAGKAIVFNAAAGVTAGLPAAAGADGEVYFIRSINSGVVTIDPNASEQIEGATTLVLRNGDAAMVWPNADKTAWRAMVSQRHDKAVRGDRAQSFSPEERSQARDNIGLGTAATQSIGTSGGNVPLLNATNTWGGAQTFSGGIQVNNGSAAAPSMALASEAGTGMFGSPGNLAAAVAGTEVGRWIASNFLIGITGILGNGQAGIQLQYSAGAFGRLNVGSAGTGATTLAIWRNPNGQVGSIVTSSSATTYNTSSDATLKENARAFDSGAIVDGLTPWLFDWKSGGTGYGVMAQDAYQVFPDMITVGGWFDRETGQPCDEHDEKAEYQPWQADYSKLVPVLLREIKDLRARVAAMGG